MTEGGKDTIKKTGDHNWDMEGMQFEKERGNFSDEKDNVNSKIRAAKVQEAMRIDKTDELSTTSN